MWLSCGKSVSAQIISFFIPYQRLLQPVPELNVTSWLLEVRLIVSGACPRNGERNLTVKICQSSQKLPWQSGCLGGAGSSPCPGWGLCSQTALLEGLWGCQHRNPTLLCRRWSCCLCWLHFSLPRLDTGLGCKWNVQEPVCALPAVRITHIWHRWPLQ